MNKNKFLVYQNMKEEHGIQLTRDQLDLINNVYNEREAENKSNLMFYRFINFILGSTVFVIFLFVRHDDFSYWVSIGLTVFFTSVNFFYMCLNAFRLSEFKKKNKIKTDD